MGLPWKLIRNAGSEAPSPGFLNQNPQVNDSPGDQSGPLKSEMLFLGKSEPPGGVGETKNPRALISEPDS